MGTSRAAASASACGVHSCQCTGLSACWRKYGLVASARVFVRDESAGLIAWSRCTRGPLVGSRIGLGVVAVEGFGDLPQLLVHRPQQNRRGDHQQHHNQQPQRAGLPKVGSVVVGRAVSNHGEQKVVHGSVSIPSNSSVSGGRAGTRERANSNSSVGHSRCCHSIGAAKNSAFGSIWVACAFSASSRWLKYFEHSTRVVTRGAKGSCSGSQCASHLPNGPSWPFLANSSCSICIRSRRKPWT